MNLFTIAFKFTGIFLGCTLYIADCFCHCCSTLYGLRRTGHRVHVNGHSGVVKDVVLIPGYLIIEGLLGLFGGQAGLVGLLVQQSPYGREAGLSVLLDDFHSTYGSSQLLLGHGLHLIVAVAPAVVDDGGLSILLLLLVYHSKIASCRVDGNAVAGTLSCVRTGDR